MRLRHTTAFLAGLALLWLAPLEAAIESDQIIYPRAESPAEAPVQDDEPMDNLFAGGKSAAGMIVTVLGYAIILGGLGVAAWVLFKRGVLRKTFKGGEGKLRVAESRMLGNRQFLMVVEYEDHKILLGVGPGKIDYLTSLQGAGEMQAFELPGSAKGGIAK